MIIFSRSKRFEFDERSVTRHEGHVTQPCSVHADHDVSLADCSQLLVERQRVQLETADPDGVSVSVGYGLDQFVLVGDLPLLKIETLL